MDARLIGAFMITPIFLITGIGALPTLSSIAPYNYAIAACLLIGALWSCAETIRLERGVSSSKIYNNSFIVMLTIDFVCFSIVLCTRLTMI